MLSSSSSSKKVRSSSEEGSSSLRFFDLTAKITSNTVVYPGDPSFSSEPISSIKDGEGFKLCLMRLGNHTGTHIDFPAHVKEGGENK